MSFNDTFPAPSETSVYVGNLSWDSTWESVNSAFDGFNCSDVDIGEMRNGRARGWAILKFSNAADAQEVIDSMNGFSLDGRELRVKIDDKPARKPRKERAPRQRREPEEVQDIVSDEDAAVYVGNLSWDSTWESVNEVYADYNCTNVDMGEDRNGRARGWAIVTFATAADANAAIAETNGMELDGRELRVRPDNKRGGNGGGGSSAPRQSRRRQQRNYDDYEDVALTDEDASVYVGNLSWDTTWETLNDTYAEFNAVEVDIGEVRRGRARGWGIIKFATAADANAAIEATSGMSLDGRQLRVRADRQR